MLKLWETTYLEFCCASRSLATFNKKFPLEKLMPVGDALSLLVPNALVTPPLFIFVIKWSTPGAVADPVVWLCTLLGV